MATVVAWGAKFSEHPLLVADRLNSPARQSSLAKTLIVRAREVAEALKVHRVPAAEHVVIALLIEPLQSRALHPYFCTVMHGGSYIDTSLSLWLPEIPDDACGQCIYLAQELQKVFSCRLICPRRFPRVLADVCHPAVVRPSGAHDVFHPSAYHTTWSSCIDQSQVGDFEYSGPRSAGDNDICVVDGVSVRRVRRCLLSSKAPG